MPAYIVTPLQAILEIVPSPNSNVKFAPGCHDVACTNQSFFPAAIQAAKESDVAFLFMGTSTSIESEGNDRSSIALPGQQEALIQSIKSTGVKTVVIFINGGALSSPWTSSNADALLEAFFGGQEAG